MTCSFTLQDVFSKSEGDIGRAPGARHKIDAANSSPVKQNPRRLPLGRRQEADSAVEKIYERRVTDKSTGPWCSPVLSAKEGRDYAFLC